MSKKKKKNQISSHNSVNKHDIKSKTEQRNEIKDSDVYSISSLSEYFDLISKLNHSKYYFRGENGMYLDTNVSIKGFKAGLFRNFIPSNDLQSLHGMYSEHLYEYYRETGYHLDAEQKDNFLAFAQHHGLKTNLLDFTTAPLVALYFACDKEKYKSDESDIGYVYGIEKQKTVDASSFIRKYSFDYRDGLLKNYLYSFVRLNEEVWSDYGDVIDEYSNMYTTISTDYLIQELLKYISAYGLWDETLEYIEALDDLNKDKYIIQALKDKVPTIRTECRTYINMWYMYLLYIALNNTIYNFGFPSYSIIPLPPMPYLITKTPLVFDRIENQKGVFIHQAYFDIQTGVDEIGGIAIQDIRPDITIQVTDQEKIMNELALAGIDRKYIYGDYDNIAKLLNRRLINRGFYYL